MAKPTYKNASALTSGDRINFFRGESLTCKTGERNEALTDTVKTVQPVEGGMVRIETVSGHVLLRASVCSFRLAEGETVDVRPLAGKPRSQTVRGVSIE